MAAIRPVGAETLAALERIAVRQDFGRGQVIVQAGRRVRYIDIIEEGIAIVCLDVDGTEKILAIGEEKSPFSSAYSINTKQPAIFSMKALTDCRVVRFPLEEFWPLAETHQDLQQWLNMWFVMQMGDIEWKCGWYCQTTIYERYCNFMTSRPRVAKELTTQQIAGYLDCTRETVSRCRSRFLKEGRK